MEAIAAPGARVLIRDAEWLVRRVDPSTDGGELLVCDGVSDLVRGRTAHFLTKLEERIELLHEPLRFLRRLRGLSHASMADSRCCRW